MQHLPQQPCCCCSRPGLVVNTAATAAADAAIAPAVRLPQAHGAVAAAYGDGATAPLRCHCIAIASQPHSLPLDLHTT